MSSIFTGSRIDICPKGTYYPETTFKGCPCCNDTIQEYLKKDLGKIGDIILLQPKNLLLGKTLSSALSAPEVRKNTTKEWIDWLWELYQKKWKENYENAKKKTTPPVIEELYDPDQTIKYRIKITETGWVKYKKVTSYTKEMDIDIDYYENIKELINGIDHENSDIIDEVLEDMDYYDEDMEDIIINNDDIKLLNILEIDKQFTLKRNKENDDV